MFPENCSLKDKALGLRKTKINQFKNQNNLRDNTINIFQITNLFFNLID